MQAGVGPLYYTYFGLLLSFHSRGPNSPCGRGESEVQRPPRIFWGGFRASLAQLQCLQETGMARQVQKSLAHHSGTLHHGETRKRNCSWRHRSTFQTAWLTTTSYVLREYVSNKRWRLATTKGPWIRLGHTLDEQQALGYCPVIGARLV
jgi:hypothetical protein